MWHWGQMLRAGVFRTQALARRLRLLALEVFFFGTAIVVPVCCVTEISCGGDRCRAQGADPHNRAGGTGPTVGPV